jgi:uncharacterized protein with PQ loop repeat
VVQHHRVHHLQKNKKKLKKKEPFDYVVYFFMIATPMFEVPQAYAIYSNQSAENVSPFTWGFFFVASIVWLTYAIKNKLKPLIFMYSMYILVEATIVTGIIVYS